MKKLLVGLLTFVMHVAIGIVGVEFITFVSAFLVVAIIRHFIPSISPKLPSVLCTQVPGFPLQLVFGFAIGFLLWRLTKQRVAFWAWTPAVALLLLTIIKFALARSGESSFPQIAVLSLEHFFGKECTLQQHCFDQVMYTLPSVAAASYSFGAFIASRRSRTVLSPTGDRPPVSEIHP